jgi:glycosyltransferase involved in cell wall biosynthesis
MKVAYFTESLPPMTDGVTRTLCNLVETLESERVDYHFFSPVKPGETVDWHNKVRKVFSVPFLLYDTYRVGVPYFHGLEAELDSFDPDLIHVISPTLLGLYGLNYAKKRTLPVVTSYHTHFVSYFSYYGLSTFDRAGWSYLQWFHNRCDRTYAPSSSAARELEQKGIKDVELWLHGIDLNKFSPRFRSNALRQSIGAQDVPILLYVGRLVKEKDLDDLVEANNMLSVRGYDFKLVIVGDGPMKEELMARLPQAHFTGYQHGENLSSWYASSDIFLFPSTTETFGNVILEAFASGLPVITVAKGGVADLVTPGIDGFITRPNDPHDFSEKISLLLDDPSYTQQLSIQAVRTASRYSWHENNRKLINSYQELLRKMN